jgi:hypothetical protein
MQIRLFREHKNDAALKCEIQDFPTKAFQRVGVDQSPLLLVLQLVLLDISSIAFWSDYREASPKVQTTLCRLGARTSSWCRFNELCVTRKIP